VQADNRVDSAWFKRLKLKHHQPLSSFAFNFQLRPHVLAVSSQSFKFKQWHLQKFRGVMGALGRECASGRGIHGPKP